MKSKDQLFGLMGLVLFELDSNLKVTHVANYAEDNIGLAEGAEFVQFLKERIRQEEVNRLERLLSEHIISHGSFCELLQLSADNFYGQVVLSFVPSFGSNTGTVEKISGSIQVMDKIVGKLNFDKDEHVRLSLYSHLLQLKQRFSKSVAKEGFCGKKLKKLFTDLSQLLDTPALIYFAVEPDGSKALRVSGFSKGKPYQLSDAFRSYFQTIDLKVFADAKDFDMATPTFIDSRILAKLPFIGEIFTLFNSSGFYYFPLIQNDRPGGFWICFQSKGGPRLSQVVIDLLTKLTFNISSQIQLVEAYAANKKILDLLEQSQFIGNVGHYLVYLEEGKVETSKVLDQLLGINNWEKVSLDDWFSRIHEDDRARISEQHLAIMESSGAYKAKYRYELIPGNFVWREVTAEVGILNGKKILRGTLRDIDEDQKRLMKIRLQSQRFKEIAWQSSHAVRGPLTRLQTILMEAEAGNISLPEFQKVLLKTSREIDEELLDVLKLASEMEEVSQDDESELALAQSLKAIKEQELLVVDDDTVIRMIHSNIIERKLGLRPKLFISGNDVINYFKMEKINSATKYKEYTLFLDLNMPDGNGWDVLEFLEGHEGIRVIIVSSTFDDNEINMANSYSIVQDFLTKPLTSSKLVEVGFNSFNNVF